MAPEVWGHRRQVRAGSLLVSSCPMFGRGGTRARSPQLESASSIPLITRLELIFPSCQCPGPPLELFHVLCFGHPAENINIKCQYTHLYLQYLIVSTTFTCTLHLLHVFYCLQNRKQHLATTRQQIGVQRLLISNLKVLLCCWCCDHGVPVPASSLGLSSPRLRSPSLNIPRPPTLNFPNLKSISVWKSTINFIFPGYIMPHFFCQYKRKRKCLLKHYFSSPSMECRYYLLCHFRKNVSMQWYSLDILKLIVLVSAWVGALWYYLSN